MEALYLLVPLALLLVGLVAAALVWAVRSGQFDDLDGPAHRILMDDDGELERPPGGKVASPPAARAGAEGGDADRRDFS